MPETNMCMHPSCTRKWSPKKIDVDIIGKIRDPFPEWQEAFTDKVPRGLILSWLSYPMCKTAGFEGPFSIEFRVDLKKIPDIS